MHRRLLPCVAVTLALGSVPSAQRAPGPLYVEAGGALTGQAGPSGTESETYVAAPGGTTAGWLLAAGFQVWSHASIFGEWSTTGRMTASEPSRYFMTYEEERRDRFLTLGLRLVLPAGRTVALEPMAGLVVTFPQAWSQAVYTDPTAPRPPQPRIEHRLDAGVGPAVGCDVRIGGHRVSLVPSFHLLRSRISNGRYDDTPSAPEVDIESIYPGGYPGWTFRTSVALRLRF